MEGGAICRVADYTLGAGRGCFSESCTHFVTDRFPLHSKTYLAWPSQPLI